MTALETIEGFLAEMREAGSAYGERFERTMLEFARSEKPLDIETSDAICEVIRRKKLSVKERAKLIVPILQRHHDSSPSD
jgi:hypothetical protein